MVPGSGMRTPTKAVAVRMKGEGRIKNILGDWIMVPSDWRGCVWVSGFKFVL